MKTLKYFLLLFIFSTLSNCDQKAKDKNAVETEKKLEIIEESISSKEEKTQPELYFLHDLLGQYPTQADLFNNPVMINRLRKINRLNFDNLIANWNVETPLTKENQIIHASGCKKNNCPSSGYELFIDLENDNINIYHFKENTLRVYTEKDWIDLPKGFNDEIEIKKSNAKIGSMNDDMTSTYTIYSKNKPKK